MAKVVYGVSGEGSGHSSRAREMAGHLVDEGHEVKLVSYDRGYHNLKDDFDVFETEGLTIASRDNRVSIVRTFTENLKRLPEGFEKLNQLRHQLFKAFEPDVVITDFEPMTAYLANHYDLPLVTIDNQHRMRYMHYEVPPGSETEGRMTRTVIRALVPRPDVSLVTTFYDGEPKNDRTFLFPPILRKSILGATPTTGEHILVYVTGGFESLIDVLRGFTRESFLVYGCPRDGRDGVLEFKPFSRDGFVRDLASAKAVIGTAGFMLISESLHLKKPYLAFPMRGQYEQELNGFMLHKLGFGKCSSVTSSETIGDFLYHEVEYRDALESYRPRDNSAIKNKLDALMDDGCALARDFHRRRNPA